MGLYDTVRIKYQGHGIGNVSDQEFQTKDTPAQYLDHYEIREDGTLWHQDYDVEDRSDPSKPGLFGMLGMMTPVNKRWNPVDFTGQLDVGDYVFWIKNGAVADVVIVPSVDSTEPIANNHKTD